jgi:hypothetical protein
VILALSAHGLFAAEVHLEGSVKDAMAQVEIIVSHFCATSARKAVPKDRCPGRAGQRLGALMNAQLIFAIASVVFAVAIVVGANIWALRDPPETQVQRSLSEAIDEWLKAEERAPEIDQNSRHNGDRPS